MNSYATIVHHLRYLNREELASISKLVAACIETDKQHDPLAVALPLGYDKLTIDPDEPEKPQASKCPTEAELDAELEAYMRHHPQLKEKDPAPLELTV